MDIYFIKNTVCIIVIIIAFVCTVLPSSIIYTANCKRSWIVVLTILSSCFFIIDKGFVAQRFEMQSAPN